MAPNAEKLSLVNLHPKWWEQLSFLIRTRASIIQLQFPILKRKKKARTNKPSITEVQIHLALIYEMTAKFGEISTLNWNFCFIKYSLGTKPRWDYAFLHFLWSCWCYACIGSDTFTVWVALFVWYTYIKGCECSINCKPCQDSDWMISSLIDCHIVAFLINYAGRNASSVFRFVLDFIFYI